MKLTDVSLAHNSQPVNRESGLSACAISGDHKALFSRFVVAVFNVRKDSEKKLCKSQKNMEMEKSLCYNFFIQC